MSEKFEGKRERREREFGISLAYYLFIRLRESSCSNGKRQRKEIEKKATTKRNKVNFVD